MKLVALLLSLIIALAWPSATVAQLESPNYKLKDYSVGTDTLDPETGSASYKLYAESGDGVSAGGDASSVQGGLQSSLQAPTPQTPTLENPADYYDRLKFTLDQGEDSNDFLYAIAISKDDFVTTEFISENLTVVATESESTWQTFDEWGGEEGGVVTGLSSNAEYKIKVKSKQGDFTDSNFSPTAAAETTVPSLTFSIDGDADMGVWGENNNYSSTAVSALTTSTNAYNGYKIYAFATQPLTRQNGTETISNIAASYASPISWTSGLGFGYTTNDTSIDGVQHWNQNPCPGDGGAPLCYAPFSHTGPGDVVADHESALGESTIVDEEFLLTYKVVTEATQVAGTYSTTIVYTVVPTY